MEELYCSSWHSFVETLRSKIYRDTPPIRGRYLFRGQGDAAWPLQTSFDRAFSAYPHGERKSIEKALLDRFKDYLKADANYHDLAEDEIAVRALAQHHGMPTRLLDWSDSPYAAAFFAFSGHYKAVLSNATLGEYVAIYALDREDGAVWDSETGVSVVHPSAWKNPRLKGQFGWFTYAKTAYATLEEHVALFPGHKDALRKLLIPVLVATEAIPHLDIMGISHETLFPDLYGAVSAVLTRELLRLTATTSK